MTQRALHVHFMAHILEQLYCFLSRLGRALIMLHYFTFEGAKHWRTTPLRRTPRIENWAVSLRPIKLLLSTVEHEL